MRLLSFDDSKETCSYTKMVTYHVVVHNMENVFSITVILTRNAEASVSVTTKIRILCQVWTETAT
jgi:hypothetical protein